MAVMPDGVPRIRGENPPPWAVEKHLYYRSVLSSLDGFYHLSIVVFFIALLFIFIFHSSLVPVIIAAAAGLGYLLTGTQYNHTLETMGDLPAVPTTLHAYPTAFTLLLADNSTTDTVVHFEIPADRQGVIEQLNRVTEKELLIFAADKRTPPEAAAIEDYLHRALVRFQNENQLSVLRVQVTVHLHIKKPEGPGALYV
jgi:hypothetical protein